MLLKEGKCLSKHTYIVCLSCSTPDEPSDIKRHMIYAKKRLCMECGTVHIDPSLSFTRGFESLIPKITQPISLF